MRSKLVEAREKKGWTQLQAASELGVNDTTLQNWEYGKSKPRGYNKQRLCEVYEADLYELGLEGIGVTDSDSVTPLSGSNFLETKLLTIILQWPRSSLDYGELQRKMRQEMQIDMANRMSRRKAMELTATLGASVFGLSPLKASDAQAEEIMPWLAGGITACWDLGRGNDLMLASSVVSWYIPTLTQLSAQPRYRKPAAKLAGEAWLLKATLGWHTETLGSALTYALEAEKYAKRSEDYTLQVDALHRVGMIHYYSKRYDMALTKIEEAAYIIEHNHVPRTVPRTIYMDIATYQACNGYDDEAKRSMKKAYRYFGAQPDPDDPTATMLGYDAPDTLRWEGLAWSHLGDHGAALDSFEQVAGKPEGIAERIRVELLCNQLNSQLRRKERDLEECIALWRDAITGAKELQSERRYSEALELYEKMECVFPGEKRIADLKPLIAHW